MISHTEVRHTMRRLVLPIVILAAGLAMIGQCTKPAHAQANCAVHAEGMEKLAQMFGEHSVFQGTSDNGMTIVVAASVKGSYTVVFVRPDGIGCVVDSGEGASVQPIRAPESKS